MAELWVNPREKKNGGGRERQQDRERDKQRQKTRRRSGLRKTVREVGCKGYIDRYEDYRS